MKKHLDGLKADYIYMDSRELKKKFSMLNHPDTYFGIYEPTGGMLKADKCVSAIQVNIYQNIYSIV